MSTAEKRRPATIEEWLATEHTELIRGTLVEKAAPLIRHSASQGETLRTLGNLFRGGRDGGPQGWRFFVELDVRLGHEGFRPDVCGYKRDRVPPDTERPVSTPPDWVCEILSKSNASNDRVEKVDSYFRAGIPHYWLIDPEEGSLEVLRRTDLAYAIVLTARKGQRVRAEPFDAVEIAVNDLLGLDSEDE